MNTLFEALTATATAYPENPFLAAPPCADRAYLQAGAEYTFGEIHALASGLAAAYAKAGWGMGRRVALALDNHPHHVAHFLALNAIGASQVPVNPYYLRDELAYLLDHSEAELVVAPPAARAKIAEAGDVPIVEYSGDETPAAFAPPSPSPRAATDGAPGRGTEIALVYTSGTTSRPKGCVLDNDYALTAGACYRDCGGRLALDHGGERVFVPLPFFHINAGINTVAAMILTANCMIAPDRFRAGSWWDDLAATGATAMHYLGIIPPALLNAPPSARDKTSGVKFGLGAGLDPTIHRAFEDRFGIPMIEVWGMTETGRFLADCHEPRAIDTRAFGRPGGGMLAKVTDDDGREVPRGTAGELVVRAAGDDPRQGFFREYLKNPTATNEAWRDGWFRTGDVVSQDESGMLYFVERAKNLIRRSGENISAAEVEAALIEHPAIAQVAVIACPDEMRDEEVFACIAANTASVDAEEVLAFARGRLAYYKLPAWIAFMDELPVTGTQKIQKHQIFPRDADPRDDPRAIDLREAKSASRRAAS